MSAPPLLLALGQSMAKQAMLRLVVLAGPRIGEATDAQLDQVCAAMREANAGRQEQMTQELLAVVDGDDNAILNGHVEALARAGLAKLDQLQGVQA